MPANLPTWAAQLRDRWAANISSVFLLTGNTRDYVSGDYPMLVSDFLEVLLRQDFGVVGFYNRATGLSIPDREQEAEFLKRSGGAGTSAPAAGAAKLPQEPMRFFPAADKALRGAIAEPSESSKDKPVALVIEYADTLFPNSPALTPEERSALIYCQRWAIDQELINTGPLVVLVAPALSDVNPALRAASSRVEHLEVPMPDYDTRLSFIRSLAEKAEPRLRLADMTPEELAAKTAGLNLLGIEDVKLRAGDQPVTAELVRERKDEIIKSEVGDVLASDDPTWGLDAVGGLDEVKSWLQRSIIRPLQTGKLRRVPQGVLLAGPPGTGKTYLAKALAHDAGVNYREVDFGRLLNGIVGSSEKNLENVLRVLEASSPCLVFIDELDQALRRGTDGLNPVQDNIFGRMLRWLSDPTHRGRIVVLAATNRPDLLDAALKRAGRFDAKIPILPPDLDGRKDGLAKLLRRYSPASIGCEAAVTDIAGSADGWTMAELELVVVKAVELADDDDREDVSSADLLDARSLVSPSTAETQYMTDLAIVECTDKSLLPAGYRSKLDNRPALEEAVREQEPRFRRARRPFSEEAA
jgi:SpoVK/Ycf46/Vps4 family AAA+-type ATPase